MCRCHGIHTSGMVQRLCSGRKLSGSVSSRSTIERAVIVSSVYGVSISTRRTRLPKTSS